MMGTEQSRKPKNRTTQPITGDPMGLYLTIMDHYGPQQWWPAGSPFAMMVGAILVQNTAWSGADKGVAQLQAAGLLSPAAIRNAEDETLWAAIRPAGFFKVKTKRLRALVEFLAGFDDQLGVLFAMDKAALRETLLEVHGIGKETADSIICYAAHKPIFVVDAYTHRLFSRLGWQKEKLPYDVLRLYVEQAMADHEAQLGEFHALIVRHAKSHRLARPLCIGCPVARRIDKGDGGAIRCKSTFPESR